jgi:hypothetical protein
VKIGWDSNRAGIYVVVLDKNPLPLRPVSTDISNTLPPSAPVPINPPLYGCIDGWHRLAAIKSLVTAEPDGVFHPLWQEENGRFVSADDSSSIFPKWPLDVDTARSPEFQSRF